MRVLHVVARNKQHAEEQIWLHHVHYTQLREQIEFMEIKEMIA